MLDTAIRLMCEDLTVWDELLNQSEARSGPFDGGCLICAKALIHALGSGHLVRIVSAPNQQTEHYGAIINGTIFDFDGGAHSSEEWMKRFTANEYVHDRVLSVQHRFDSTANIPDDPKSVKRISRLLCSYMPTPTN